MWTAAIIGKARSNQTRRIGMSRPGSMRGGRLLKKSWNDLGSKTKLATKQPSSITPVRRLRTRNRFRRIREAPSAVA
jgi:hypothetical protein